MKTRLLGGIVALVLALVGTLLLVSYVQGAEQRAQKDLQPVDVLVIQKEIPEGAGLETIRSSVKLTSFPSAAVPNGALKSLEGIDGKVASSNLMPGEALLGGRLVEPSSLSAPGSVAVPDGMQEVSVQLGAPQVVGGRISAGDTVGLIVTFPEGGQTGSSEPTAQMVYHKVLVTRIQRAAPETSAATDPQAQEAAANTQLPSGSMIVTFARNDADATKIVFAASYGQIWLTKEPASAAEGSPLVVKKTEIFK